MTNEELKKGEGGDEHESVELGADHEFESAKRDQEEKQARFEAGVKDLLEKGASWGPPPEEGKEHVQHIEELPDAGSEVDPFVAAMEGIDDDDSLKEMFERAREESARREELVDEYGERGMAFFHAEGAVNDAENFDELREVIRNYFSTIPQGGKRELLSIEALVLLRGVRRGEISPDVLPSEFGIRAKAVELLAKEPGSESPDSLEGVQARTEKKGNQKLRKLTPQEGSDLIEKHNAPGNEPRRLEFNEAVASTVNFEELYSAIEGIGEIMGTGTDHVYSPEELISIIQKVRTGEARPINVTRTNGVREKVIELLNRERSLDEDDQHARELEHNAGKKESDPFEGTFNHYKATAESFDWTHGPEALIADVGSFEELYDRLAMLQQYEGFVESDQKHPDGGPSFQDVSLTKRYVEGARRGEYQLEAVPSQWGLREKVQDLIEKEKGEHAESLVEVPEDRTRPDMEMVMQSPEFLNYCADKKIDLQEMEEGAILEMFDAYGSRGEVIEEIKTITREQIVADTELGLTDEELASVDAYVDRLITESPQEVLRLERQIHERKYLDAQINAEEDGLKDRMEELKTQASGHEEAIETLRDAQEATKGVKSWRVVGRFFRLFSSKREKDVRKHVAEEYGLTSEKEITARAREMEKELKEMQDDVSQSERDQEIYKRAVEDADRVVRGAILGDAEIMHGVHEAAQEAVKKEIHALVRAPVTDKSLEDLEEVKGYYESIKESSEDRGVDYLEGLGESIEDNLNFMIERKAEQEVVDAIKSFSVVVSPSEQGKYPSEKMTTVARLDSLLRGYLDRQEIGSKQGEEARKMIVGLLEDKIKGLFKDFSPASRAESYAKALALRQILKKVK